MDDIALSVVIVSGRLGGSIRRPQTTTRVRLINAYHSSQRIDLLPPLLTGLISNCRVHSFVECLHNGSIRQSDTESSTQRVVRGNGPITRMRNVGHAVQRRCSIWI